MSIRLSHHIAVSSVLILCVVILADAVQSKGIPLALNAINHDEWQTNKVDYVREHIFTRAKSISNVTQTQPSDTDDDRRTSDHEPTRTFLDWYEDGVSAYVDKDWSGCIEKLQLAIAGYRDYFSATASCRIQCASLARQVAPFFADDVDNLHFYESVMRRTLCLVKCKRLLMPSLPEFFHMNKWSKEVFRTGKPYTYLQMCYYKTNRTLEATSATYTALLRNPEDRMMVSNFQYYLSQIENTSVIKDLDQRKYAQFYVDGLDAYGDENYAEVLVKMEKSLKQYVLDLNECRAFCESEFNQGWLPDFVTAVANHFTYNLRCKRNCTENLGIIRGRVYQDVFASHYEYLQISYFRENNSNEACRAAASFLLIHPDSEQMLENLSYYQKGKLIACKPRTECVLYLDQQRYEQRLLKFVGDEFAEEVIRKPTANDINSSTRIDEILRQD